MRRIPVTSIRVIVLILFSLPFGNRADTGGQPVSYGKDIYRNGMRPNGKPIEATGAGGTRLNGRQVTCYNCHRRSGLGTSEGNKQVPPITGNILFQDRTRTHRELRKIRLSGAGARPAYDKDSLKRAITEGIDVTGRTMDTLMPRFEFSDKELDYLIAYLMTLTTASPPGVTNNEVRLATVFTPGTDEALKKSALQIMQKYFHDYNSRTRNEKRRAKNAPWHKAWQYASYRDIRLASWELTGSAAGWADQLSDYYRKTPVFALINGIGPDTWQPVHDFCGKHKIPCLFPTTDYPGESGVNIYNMYFSNGLKTEAQVLSDYLAGQQSAGNGVLQLYNSDGKSMATHRYLAGLLRRNNIAVENAAIEDTQKLQARLVSRPGNHYDFIVMWVNAAEVNALQDKYNIASLARKVFISSTYISSPSETLPKALLGKVFYLSRFVTAEQKSKNLRRLAIWAKQRNIPITDERAAANAYFSAIVAADAIKNMRANLNRDYLIERIEHMLERSVFHSVYPELKLGPEQRFASKGCFITGPLGQAGGGGAPLVNKWFVANNRP